MKDGKPAAIRGLSPNSPASEVITNVGFRYRNIPRGVGIKKRLELNG